MHGNRSWRVGLCLAAVLSCCSIARADYEAGQTAWQVGRPAEALTQWQAAARDGDARAMLALGRAYVKGLGVPQDYVEAHKWLNLAAGRGNAEAADEREALAAKMTLQQIASAQEQARAWRSGSAVDAPKAVAVPQAAVPSPQAGPPPPRAIKEAQELLTALGYEPGPADGRWGSRSASAYAAFLRDAGLPPENMLTPDALRAMRAVAKGLNVAATEASPPKASATQRKPAPPPADLHRLVAAGDIDGLKKALDGGADPNIRDARGWTALMHAADKGYALLVPSLLEVGADPNLRLADGATALFIAALHGHSEIVAALMEAGADPSIEGPKGRTLVDVARARGNSGILELPEVAALLEEKARRERQEEARRQRAWEAQRAERESDAFSRARSLGTPEAFVEHMSRWCPAGNTCEEAASALDESIRSGIAGKIFGGTNSLGDRHVYRFSPSGEVRGTVRPSSWMRSECSGSWSVEGGNIGVRCRWPWPTGWSEFSPKLDGKVLVGRENDRGTIIAWRLEEQATDPFTERTVNRSAETEEEDYSAAGD